MLHHFGVGTVMQGLRGESGQGKENSYKRREKAIKFSRVSTFDTSTTAVHLSSPTAFSVAMMGKYYIFIRGVLY